MKWCAVLLVVVCCLMAVGQEGKPQRIERSAPAPQFPDNKRNEPPRTGLEMAREQQKKRIKQRYADLRRDTDTLHRLASELKEEVAKTDENVLSVDVIGKTEQIEKLAKSVRNKMKQTETPI